MMIKQEVINFTIFLILGIIISCVLDVFRTLRKIKKKNSIYVIALQDIIFFLIATIITIACTLNIIKDNIRGYMFIAIVIGIAISRITISKLLIKIYSKIIITFSWFVNFLCVPISLWASVVLKIIKKVAKKCCKLFFLMINLKCKLLTVFGNMNNFKKVRGLFKNEKKSRKYEEKTKRQKEEKVF